jgi:hypothetical protein
VVSALEVKMNETPVCIFKSASELERAIVQKEIDLLNRIENSSPLLLSSNFGEKSFSLIQLCVSVDFSQTEAIIHLLVRLNRSLRLSKKSVDDLTLLDMLIERGNLHLMKVIINTQEYGKLKRGDKKKVYCNIIADAN